jgi:hypothetical protein
MALPVIINPATPPGSETPALGDDQLRALKQAILDLFGMAPATPITAPLLAVGNNVDGKVAIAPVVKNAGPFQRLIGTEVAGRDVRWVENSGSMQLQRNDGPEAAPTWVDVLTIVLSTGQIVTRGLVTDVVNVRGMGATGNNVTDDTGIIQQAMDLGYALGWPVYFPPGNYKTTTTIGLHPAQRVFGAGAVLSRVFASTPGQFVFGATATTPGWGHIHIRDLLIDGMALANVGGIVLNGADTGKRINGPRLEDVTIESCTIGLYLLFCANTWLTDLLVIACTTGIRLDFCADSNLTACEVQSGSGIGFYFNGDTTPFSEGYRLLGCSTNGQGKGLSVTGCGYGAVTASSFTTCGAGDGVAISNSVHWKFSGCEMAACSGAGFVDDVSCQDIEINGGTVLLNTFGVAFHGVRERCIGVGFQNNTQQDIILDGATKCVVNANICDSSTQPESIRELNAADYNNIQGNVVNGTIVTLGIHTVAGTLVQY